MEAKDIVINIRKSVELPKDRSFLSMLDFTDKVAEISFKAGQESEVDHSADRCAAYLDASRKEGFKAGEDKGKQEGQKSERERLIREGLLTEKQWMFKFSNALKARATKDSVLFRLFKHIEEESKQEGFKEVTDFLRENCYVQDLNVTGKWQAFLKERGK